MALTRLDHHNLEDWAYAFQHSLQAPQTETPGPESSESAPTLPPPSTES